MSLQFMKIQIEIESKILLLKRDSCHKTKPNLRLQVASVKKSSFVESHMKIKSHEAKLEHAHAIYS